MTNMKVKSEGMKRALAWILTAVIALSGNGALFAFAGSSSDVLDLADGELTVNAAAAVQTSIQN